MIRFKYLFKLSLIMVLCISLFTHGVSANLAEMNDEVQTELQEYETVNLPHISVTDSVYKNLDVPTLLADDELVVYPGQSFEIYNITSSSLTQYNNASLSAERYFDYVSYREDGTIYNLGWDTAVNHAVPRGGVFVITVTSPNPVTFKTREGLIPSRTERPALKKETLYRGQNISVVNNTAGSSSILANTNRSESKWLDYSLYDVDGNYRSFAFQTTSLPSIPSGGEMILSSSGVSPVTIAVPYIGFDIRSSMEPALHNITLNQGQSYELNNIGNRAIRMESDATSSNGLRFDYAVYLPDGTSDSRGVNTYTTPSISAGNKVVVTTVSHGAVNFGVPYRLFSGRYVSGPAIKRITLNEGQSYVFRNHGSKSNPIYIDTSITDGSYDYSIYKSDGNMASSTNWGMDSKGSKSISAGGYAIITVSSSTPVTFEYTDDFSVEVYNTSALLRVTIPKDQSYEFENIGNLVIIPKSNAAVSNGLRFDYAVYLPDGTSTRRSVDTYSPPYTTAGDRAVVTTVSEEAVTFAVPYDLFEGRNVPGPAIKRFRVHEGQSYVFRNHGSQSNSIDIDTPEGSFDYVLYNSNGTNPSSFWNMDYKKDLTIPAGGYAIVTVNSSTPVTFRYTDDFSVEVSTSPALLRVTIPKGQSYEFININSKTNIGTTPKSDATVSNGLRFDYAVYLPDGTSTRRSVDTYFPPSLAAGDRAVVTTVSEEAVTFAVPYDLFEGRNVPGPAIKRFRVHEGQSYIFRNHGSQSNSIDIDTPEGSFDYVLYNSNGTNPSSFWNMDYKKDLTIPAGGYAIVTVNSSTPVTFRYTDDFSVEVSTSPALLRVTIPKGQSYEFININSKTNIGTTPKSNATLSNGLRFDYVVYLPDGSVYSNNSNTYTIPSISSGKRVVITTVSEEAVTVAAPYELFDGQFISDDAISRIMVSDGESYLFRNYGSQDSSIRNDASKVGGFFDYVVYRSDGTVAFSSFNSQSRPQIPAGGYGIITVHSPEPITFEYTSDFTVEQSAIPAMIRATLGKGESYEFTNIGNVSRKIMSTSSNSSSEPRKFNYVIYTPDGVEYSHGIDTNYEPLIKPGHKVIFTTVTVQPITFAAIYSEFEGRRIFGEPIGEDAFYDIIKEVGETGYYRIIPEQTGPYRIITKSSIDSEQQISLELYDNDQLINPLTQSTDFPSPFGEEYTYIEYNFVAGQTYYLKLSETDGEAIDVTLVASAQPWQSASEYQYDSSGKLIRIVLFSGDQILYEYDDNGNLIRKSKRVFPFINE